MATTNSTLTSSPRAPATTTTTQQRVLLAGLESLHPLPPNVLADHIEGQLSQLNHQRNMVQLGLMQARETMPGVDTPAPSGGGAGGSGGGGGGVRGGDNVKDAADKEIGFAIEMQIQVKRAEREKKRQVTVGV